MNAIFYSPSAKIIHPKSSNSQWKDLHPVSDHMTFDIEKQKNSTFRVKIDHSYTIDLIKIYE